MDLRDFFAFEIGESRRLMAETTQGGSRYRILALLDNRQFEHLQLDVNFIPDDARPIEHMQLRSVLGFAGIESPRVPLVPIAQHLAEKLHAYTRDYGQHNSRPRDLFDMLVIVNSLPLPRASALAAACQATFDLRGSTWPPHVGDPPHSWRQAWAAYVEEHSIPWKTLDDAGTALRQFWTPVLAAKTGDGASWDEAAWTWRSGS